MNPTFKSILPRIDESHLRRWLDPKPQLFSKKKSKSKPSRNGWITNKKNSKNHILIVNSPTTGKWYKRPAPGTPGTFTTQIPPTPGVPGTYGASAGMPKMSPWGDRTWSTWAGKIHDFDGFFHEKLGISVAMLVYQRVIFTIIATGWIWLVNRVVVMTDYNPTHTHYNWVVNTSYITETTRRFFSFAHVIRMSKKQDLKRCLITQNRSQDSIQCRTQCR